jgi:tetratricopeptide (TPR) repeat protein
MNNSIDVCRCHLKLNQPSSALEGVNNALQLNPGLEKALFRRGQAFLQLLKLDEAERDFKSLLDAKDKAVRREAGKALEKVTSSRLNAANSVHDQFMIIQHITESERGVCKPGVL